MTLNTDHDDLGLVRRYDAPENRHEYVRAILRRAYGEVQLMGGTRHTHLLRNRYCDVLLGIDHLIDQFVPEES